MNEVQEYKINVHADTVDGYSMGDYEFECKFYVYSNKVVTINKKDMKQQENNGVPDKDNYVAILDREKVIALGKGSVKMKFVAHIPDADFPDGTRTEVAEVNNLKIII